MQKKPKKKAKQSRLNTNARTGVCMVLLPMSAMPGRRHSGTKIESFQKNENKHALLNAALAACTSHKKTLLEHTRNTEYDYLQAVAAASAVW